MWSRLCRYVPHKRNASRVWYDNMNYRTRCVRCDAELIKDRNGSWRPFDPQSDGVQYRIDKEEARRKG